MALRGPTKPPSTLGKAQANQGEAGTLTGSFGVGALVIALVVGMQLGGIPWRYRRQIWQLQGFLLGGLAGYVLGRLNECPKRMPRLPGKDPTKDL